MLTRHRRGLRAKMQASASARVFCRTEFYKTGRLRPRSSSSHFDSSNDARRASIESRTCRHWHQEQAVPTFVEGETISDGRKVAPEMIDECVATFAPATHSPRINLEHVSRYRPEPTFNGYRNVVALEAKTDDIVIGGKSSSAAGCMRPSRATTNWSRSPEPTRSRSPRSS